MGYVQLAAFALKHWKEITLAIFFFLIIFMVVLLGGVEEETPPTLPYVGDGKGGTANVTPLVRRYEPLVRKYAEKYGVPDYVELLLAKMQQESGGRGGDPMQSSESLGLPPNTITDPEYSIDVGVFEFSEVLPMAGGEIKLALQSYNFGPAFIPYAHARGGYSKPVAVAFSNMMARKMGWSRYGDVNYVDNVLRYYIGGVFGGGDLPISDYGFMKPVDGPQTSGYGYRIDPITGTATKMHSGIDFGCHQKAIPILATKSGTVKTAGWQNPSNHKAGYGQRVYIDHGGGVITVYGHMSKIGVSVGQTVSQGQEIGKCGTTGSSTGMHLHFEVHINGRKVDPAQYL